MQLIVPRIKVTKSEKESRSDNQEKILNKKPRSQMIDDFFMFIYYGLKKKNLNEVIYMDLFLSPGMILEWDNFGILPSCNDM